MLVKGAPGWHLVSVKYENIYGTVNLIVNSCIASNLRYLNFVWNYFMLIWACTCSYVAQIPKTHPNIHICTILRNPLFQQVVSANFSGQSTTSKTIYVKIPMVNTVIENLQWGFAMCIMFLLIGWLSICHLNVAIMPTRIIACLLFQVALDVRVNHCTLFLDRFCRLTIIY